MATTFDTARYRVYVRDRDRQPVAELDDYVQIDCTQRFNGISSWVLEMHATSGVLSMFTEDSGIYITRNGQYFIAGPLSRVARTFALDKDHIILNGSDDTLNLADRLGLPVPGGPPYDTSIDDAITDTGETVMKHFVNANLGPGAIPARQVAGLTIEPDQRRGTTITGRMRYVQVLGELVNQALACGGLGFRIVQQGLGGPLQFQVYQPTDRTQAAIFSPLFGNVVDFNYLAQAPDANYIYVGGSGDGTARTIVEGGDSTSIATYNRRIEEFVNYSQSSDQTECEQQITSNLQSSGQTTTLNVTPLDTTQMAFLRDYVVGDLVSVALVDNSNDISGQLIYDLNAQQQVTGLKRGSYKTKYGIVTIVQDVVRECRVVVDPNKGAYAVPTIGTPGSTRMVGTLSLLNRDRRLSDRISLVETR